MNDDLDELFDATGEANDFDPHFEAALGHRVEMRDEIIEALTAQNRRLREALTEIEGSASPDHWSPQHQHCVDTARAALKGEPFNKRDKWGGYARPNNSHPIGDKERETGAKYIRADIACALTAENERLREALIEERTETLWNAYNTGAEQDGRWRHMCMSDGEWLARECGLDVSQADYPADVVKGEIPLAAERFVAALKGEQK